MSVSLVTLHQNVLRERTLGEDLVAGIVVTSPFKRVSLYVTRMFRSVAEGRLSEEAQVVIRAARPEQARQPLALMMAI